MKKHIISAALLLLAASASAQDASLQIHALTGDTVAVALDSIANITFEAVDGVQLLWKSEVVLSDIRGVSPALSPDGKSVYMVSNDNRLRAFSTADGSQQWAFHMRAADYGTAQSGNLAAGHSLGIPAVDTDGTIYVGDGTGAGKLFAVNADGSLKWWTGTDATTGFWNKGNASSANISYTTPLITDGYVYVGTRGSAGSLHEFDKATGKRTGFAVRPSSVTDYETAGPAGGFQTDMVANKDGLVYLYCNTYGIGAVKFSSFAHDNTCAPMEWESIQKNNTKCTGPSAIDADGNLIALIQLSSKTQVTCIAPDGNIKWTTPVCDAVTDQGGIVIDANGTIYASLKKSTTAKGGIAALRADGSLKWNYEVDENVSAAPAISKEGNVVFGSESGFIYIVNPGGQLISRTDIAQLLGNDWVAGKGRFWSSPVIDANGIIYIGVVNNAGNTRSRLVALTADGITGLATSGWPMRGCTTTHSCTAR